jgi:hypothetical protein
MKITLGEKIARVEQLLQLEFPGFQPHVEFRDRDGLRNKRKDMPADELDPMSARIEVYFDPMPDSIDELRAEMFDAASTIDTEFRPAVIRGEPLSATILRERR